MMENMKEALEYLVDLGENKEKVIEVNGESYSTESLYRIKNCIEIDYLSVNTLSGLVNYIKSDIDKNLKNKLLVRVKSPTRVSVEREINNDGYRDVLLKSDAIIPDINFNHFYGTEQFNILLQSAFIKNDDRDILLKVAGNIREETVRSTGDDGISQAVKMKTGVATVEDVIVPNPVVLIPRRTFNEIQQPESQFVFRMKDGPSCALYEADGAVWRNKAMEDIKAYLEKELEGMEGITIIS